MAILLMLFLVNELSCHMLYLKLHNDGRSCTLFDLFVDIAFIVCELIAELSAKLDGSVKVFNYPHPAEDHYAFYVQRPVSLFQKTLIVYCKTNLVAGLYRINTVSDLPSVKVYFTVLLVVLMVYGHTIRISVVPCHCKDASCFTFKKIYALLPADRLFLTSHFPEQSITPFHV